MSNVNNNLNCVQVINKPCMREARCVSLIPRTTLHSDSKFIHPSFWTGRLSCFTSHKNTFVDPCQNAVAHANNKNVCSHLPLQHVAGYLDGEDGVLQDGRHKDHIHSGLLHSQSTIICGVENNYKMVLKNITNSI